MKGFGFGSIVIVMALGFLALLIVARFIPRRRVGPQEVPRATWPLTRNEQSMYFRLQVALPDLIVLSQVSFGALLTARTWAARNTFNRKRADFVICEKSFKVVAIVELDDSSHDGVIVFSRQIDTVYPKNINRDKHLQTFHSRACSAFIAN